MLIEYVKKIPLKLFPLHKYVIKILKLFLVLSSSRKRHLWMSVHKFCKLRCPRFLRHGLKLFTSVRNREGVRFIGQIEFASFASLNYIFNFQQFILIHTFHICCSLFENFTFFFSLQVQADRAYFCTHCTQ